MKKLIVFACLLIAAAACQKEEKPVSSPADRKKAKTEAKATPAKSTKKKDDNAEAKRIYKLNCVVCHGIKGDMGASGAHDLTQSELSLKGRINVITNGRNTMTPFEDVLTKDQIKSVAKYVETLRK